MTKLHIARALVERGFSVFPVKAGAKTPPLLQDWPRRAAKTVAEVENLWAAVPEANVAIHCVGMIVLDIDTRSGGDVSLQTLGDLYDIPATLTTRTPTGGRHLFFRLPVGAAVSNSAGKLGAGLDIKTTGGYVLAPGSDVEAGRYHFENPETPIAEAPQWLTDLIGTSGSRQRDATPAAAIPAAPLDLVAQARSWLAGQPVGGGTSYAKGCGLRDRGLSLAQARLVFEEHDPRPDAIAQVEHAYRYAQGAPGAKALLESDLPVVSPAATPAPAPVAKSTVLRLDEVAASASSSEYLVKGVLQKGSYAVVYGDRGEGKTFVALDIAYHVAAGKPWMGHNTRQGTVLYLAFEGAGGLAKRAQALRRHYGEDLVPFYVDTAGYNLRELTGRAALGAVVHSLPEKPSLVVIDTFAHAMRGGDENSAQDVGAFNTAVLELIKHTGACVLVVHHSGKNKANGPRGSSALGAAIDTEIEVDSRRIKPTKQRDIELGEEIGFALHPVPLDIDEDGDVVTSCVVMPAAIAEQGATVIKGNARLAFEALCRMAPNNEPVTMESWKTTCKEFMPKATAQRFYEAKGKLLDAGLVIVDNVGMATRRLE